MLCAICERLLSAVAGIEWACDDEGKMIALELVKYDFDRVCSANRHLDPGAIGDFFVDATGRKRVVTAPDVARQFKVSADDADTIVKFIDLTFDVLQPSARNPLSL